MNRIQKMLAMGMFDDLPPVTYLLQDDFTTNDAAPLTTPRTCEPGPETIQSVETDGSLSIANDKLVFVTPTTPAWNEQGFRCVTLKTRSIGRFMFVTANFSTYTTHYFAFSDGVNLSYTHIIGYGLGSLSLNNITILNSAAAHPLDEIGSSGIDYRMAVIMRSTGEWLLVKGGAFTEWTLIYVSATATADGYPAFGNNAASGAFDTFRVGDLLAPWITDYGIATSHLVGDRSAGDTFSHEADCFIEFVCTTLPSAGNIELRFRIQDATNYLQLLISSTGGLTLNEVVGGSSTQYITVAGAVANGNRVLIIATSNYIRVHAAGVAKLLYTLANNFFTATSGLLNDEGTGGSVSEIIAWPRTLSGSARNIINRYFGAGTAASSIGTISEAAYSAPDALKTIHITSDIHADDATAGALDDFVADCNAIEFAPVATFVAGDITEAGTAADDTEALTQLAGFPTVPYVIAGNHDLLGHTIAAFAGVYSIDASGNYAVDLTFCVVICMSYKVSALDYAWLDAQLKANSAKPCVIISHAPLFNTVDAPGLSSKSSTYTMYGSYSMEQVIANNANAKAYISGHTHSPITATNFVMIKRMGSHDVAVISASSPYSNFVDANMLCSIYVTVYPTYLELRIRQFYSSAAWVNKVYTITF